MITILYIIIFLSLFLVSFSYIIYPLLVRLLAQNKELNSVVYSRSDLPRVALVFAAYNEAKVIVQKLQNIQAIDYPINCLDVYIGLDNPSDETATLIAQHNPLKFNLTVKHFKKRGGKSGVLNKLFKDIIKLSDYEVVIMSDANIISKENCVFELVKHFKNPEIGVVGAVIKNTLHTPTEIGKQEKFYIKNESQLKVNEGLVFGASIGAFGAFYAIRSNYVKPIPKNYLMEDFYLSMNVLKQGALSITNPHAIVYEDLPGTIEEEFKRKRRISTGNFQNLQEYLPFVLQGDKRVSFSFVSHKILRWFTPFLLLIMCVATIFLFVLNPYNGWHQLLIILMLVNFIMPLLDIALQKVKISVNLLRLHRYFIAMNIALFLGWIDWVKGVETNIWKPTKRT